MYNMKRIVLSILLLVIAPISWATCPDGQEEHPRSGECQPIAGFASTGKMKSHPYGGTCESVNRHTAIFIIQKVVSGGGGIRLPRGQSICKHNVELIENNNEKILDITTGLGDGIQSAYWTDIGDPIPARRRFEMQFRRVVEINRGFRLQYSVRLPDHNTWMKGVPPGAQYFWITQLHSGTRSTMPPLRVMVRKSKGIFINVGIPPAKIQDVSDFGKWVKIKLEYKPTRGNKGFKRLWVNDRQVVNENNIQTIRSRAGYWGDHFNLKFGIYQGVGRMGPYSDFDPRTVVQNSTEQQSIQFKNFYFTKI